MSAEAARTAGLLLSKTETAPGPANILNALGFATRVIDHESTPAELQSACADLALLIVDGGYFIPNSGGTAAAHILSDTPLPHLLFDNGSAIPPEAVEIFPRLKRGASRAGVIPLLKSVLGATRPDLIQMLEGLRPATDAYPESEVQPPAQTQEAAPASAAPVSELRDKASTHKRPPVSAPLKHFLEAARRLKNKEYDAAVYGFTLAVQADSDMAEAYKGLAAAYRGKRDYAGFKFALVKGAEAYVRTMRFEEAQRIMNYVKKIEDFRKAKLVELARMRTKGAAGTHTSEVVAPASGPHKALRVFQEPAADAPA